MPTLIIEFPNGKKKEYLVTGPSMLIGRKPDNPIHVPDSFVSGRHAEVRRLEDGDYQLEDIGSHNGTEVNGRRLQGPVVLRDGDHLSLGGITGWFRLADPVNPAPTSDSTSLSPKTGWISTAAVNGPTQRVWPMSLTPAPLQPPPAELVEANQKLRAARDELAAVRKSLEAVQAELAQSRKELADSKSEFEDLRKEKTAELSLLEERRRVAREETEEAKAEAARHGAAAQQAEARLDQVRELTETMRQEERSLTERLQILHRQQFALEQRSKEASSPATS